jgi:NADH-quinone oxidoreductase subunit C/D
MSDSTERTGAKGPQLKGEDQVLQELKQRFGEGILATQQTRDAMPTAWVRAEGLREVLAFLKTRVARPYPMLYDLTAIDERERLHREGQPPSDFTAVYQLFSFDRREDVRIKVPLDAEHAVLPTVTGIWPCADWYEREVWDMFGIAIEGHPRLRRILLPPWWEGHPLRKEHPARATEMGLFAMSEQEAAELDRQLQFKPEEWGLERHGEDFDYLFANLGPQHPGTHGPFRVIVQMDGEEIKNLVCDIGFHHRGAEKMGERQSWHTFIPYTDRIDYLSGVMNNYPYVLAVEALAGIEVPDRAKVIRIMLVEVFRVISHLVFLGTFAQDVGAMSPVFYAFNDRERAFDIIEAVTGARMHPSWFRIGGVAQDLPQGWQELVRAFLRHMPGSLREFDRMVLGNRIFKMRTQGVGLLPLREAIDWGATGPMLRGSGLEWDLRKDRSYGGYDQFEFDVPIATHGDAYDRAVVHREEILQSLRIIEQCVEHMPEGPYQSKFPVATPPLKERTMEDIETLIHHFLSVSWGPVVPPGEASVRTEDAKGNHSYYLVSDGGSSSYRTRIRTPSFAHVQMVPLMAQGMMIPDLTAVLGSIDFVLADVDR